ncbi:MAG: low molecular weight phosphotyrosine protein phosphatase [Chlorobiaceae bacterium]|nr:low molecular weight phosphotyrosine protein phosphatase [Chlorobiaceae bacterium]
MPIRILFVCYENICRSPMAEGAFVSLVSSMGASTFFEAESAGTVGYQSGCCPDDRAVWAAGRYGIDISTIRARCLDDLDLDRFDRIFVMDFENQRDLLDVLGDRLVPVHLMTDFAETGAGREIADPYYGDQKGFDRTMEIIMHSAREILTAMQDVYGGGCE